jgi:micrococcal nuclease
MSQEVRLKTIEKALKPFLTTKQRKTFSLILTVVSLIIVTFSLLPKTSSAAYEQVYAELDQKGELLKATINLDKECEKASLVSITDGDTIKVTRADGSKATVRYIGVDTPEIKHQGNGTTEAFGSEATALNEWLLRDKALCLQSDAGDTDKYDRLLRYVYLPDGTMVNYALIRMGYAQIMTIQPNILFQQKFLAAQTSAREEGLAMWR